MKNYKIGVLVSGGGSNMQAVIDNIKAGKLKRCEVALVISSKEGAFALERAENENIEHLVITDQEELTQELLAKGIDIVVLAGYMRVLSSGIIDAYKDRIINIHPSLIPKYSGMGFYGMRVHKAVIEAGEKESGATVHLVDEGVDTGRILIQEKIEVLKGDTPEILAKRVLKVEHKILSEGIEKVIKELREKG